MFKLIIIVSAIVSLVLYMSNESIDQLIGHAKNANAFRTEKNVGESTLHENGATSKKDYISCDGHPLSATRVTSARGVTHFTADTGEQCVSTQR